MTSDHEEIMHETTSASREREAQGRGLGLCQRCGEESEELDENDICPECNIAEAQERAEGQADCAEG